MSPALKINPRSFCDWTCFLIQGQQIEKKNVLFVIIFMIAILWQLEIPIMNKRNNFLATRRLLVSLLSIYS